MRTLIALIFLFAAGCGTPPRPIPPPPTDDGPQGDFYEADLTPGDDGSSLQD